MVHISTCITHLHINSQHINMHSQIDHTVTFPSIHKLVSARTGSARSHHIYNKQGWLKVIGFSSTGYWLLQHRVPGDLDNGRFLWKWTNIFSSAKNILICGLHGRLCFSSYFVELLRQLTL